MRNFSLSLILVMFVALFTTSCDDDEGYCSPIEGNWEIVDPPNVDYNEYSFFHDGTGAYYIEDYYGNSTYYFTWQIYGDSLYVYFTTGDTWTFRWYISNGYLYLYRNGAVVPLIYAPF